MVTVGLILAVAVAAGRWLRPPESTVAAVDWVIINLALPAVVLHTIPQLQLTTDAVVPVVTAWCMVFVGAAAVWVVARRAGWSREVTGALLLVVPLGNTSFLGFPAVEALLGTDALPTAVLYDQLGTFLALTTYGAVVAARYGAGSADGPGVVLRRVLVFPPFVALMVGFGLRGVMLPEAIVGTLELLSVTLTPLAMVSIGLRLAGRRLQTPTAPVAFGLAVRLAFMPALVLAAAALFNGSGPAWDASVLEAGMPPMVTAGIVATAAGLDDDTVVSMVGIGLVLALATVPLWALVLGP